VYIHYAQCIGVRPVYIYDTQGITHRADNRSPGLRIGSRRREASGQRPQSGAVNRDGAHLLVWILHCDMNMDKQASPSPIPGNWKLETGELLLPRVPESSTLLLCWLRVPPARLSRSPAVAFTLFFLVLFLCIYTLYICIYIMHSRFGACVYTV
jgi:hypothetical protein